MSTMPKRITASAVILALLLVAMPAAHAFFPLGFYDGNNVRRILIWDRDDFDQNNNGRIEAGEGLDVVLLGGDDGFTPAQIAVVRDALGVWGAVPTSYAAFRVDGIAQDPIQGSDTLPDFINLIAWDLDGSDTGGGVIGLTTTLFLTADGYIDVGGGRQVYFGAGEIIDSDIELDPFSLQRELPDGTVLNEPLYDLKSTLVHELGHMLGLTHTPLNNLRADFTDPAVPIIVESQVLWLTDGLGNSRYVGATPTMFPFIFDVQLTDGTLADGMGDLAPDDISGISWLYPQGTQSGFFNFSQRARTSARTGSNIPTRPLWGAHIVAWADHDNNGVTPKIPLFSTITGLYEDITYPNRLGNFEFKYLWKQMEMPGQSGAFFNPGYTFTMNPLNQLSYERQAPIGIPPDDVDSIHAGTGGHDTVFLSEVFHEVDNVLDITNVGAGTSLVWSFTRNTLISADTGRSLASILGSSRPLFGDPDNVCPLNVIEGGGGGGTTPKIAGLAGYSGPNAIRGFRDRFLLESAAGTVFVDLYYRVAPPVARFLVDNTWARDAFRRAVHTGYWFMEHRIMLSLVLAFAALGVAGAWRRVRRSRASVAGLVLLAVAVAGAGTASAGIEYLTTEDLSANTDIVHGEVVSTAGYWANGKIYTEIVVRVEEAIKGNYNKQSNVAFSIPGGTVGILAMRASEMPTFRVGDEVILWLFQRPDGSLSVRAGQRGVVRVLEDKSSAEKHVYGGSVASEQALADDRAALDQDKKADDADARTDDGRLALDTYLDYLRSLARELKRQGL